MRLPAVPRRHRKPLLALAAVLPLVVAIVVLAVERSDPPGPTATTSETQQTTSGPDLPYVDGVVTSVSQRQVTIDDEHHFTIRRQDIQAVLPSHLRIHAADRTPVRIYYEQIDGVRYALMSIDAPRTATPAAPSG